MPSHNPLSMRVYLWAWFKAAFAPAWDSFGWINRLIRTPYEIHVSQTNTIIALEAEVAAARTEIERRRKSQNISDALRSFHAEGIKLYHRRVGEDEYPQWKTDWKAFERALFEAMEQLGCSESEIHGVLHIGPVPLVPLPRDSLKAAENKSRIVAQLNHIAKVADSHDTMKPV